ncbi:FdhF/YdeP family oxidoreductase [Celerinatantimonas diazotrophica]|uniref:Molybdopterin-dependent oxidoreductase alpha subunit n=1 Tax=Celerinatantimonas diazotrophica TaxID=412034 RepID=A0A4R1JMW4_9GAMM|nr:FdhF/YdeP family oxidoreductase [Celerinatantimonas diazotrophica]TCK51859.1 molybdopterin-dependent oxidoreductase alpha subunit [Celerinatantimonas diazotrophica]CAG9296448.1 Protein YdeP [Celerinatantimonas diazotrophica]
MSHKEYQGPAGGWGALKATTTHLLKSQNVAKNISNLLRTNQDHGFDCPGCAWGEKGVPGRFRFCENGAKAVNWEATTRRVGEEFFAQYPVSWLNQQTDYFLEFQGRLAEPVRYNSVTDHYEPISWDDAFKLIATKLKELDSPNQAEFYTSGRASNEAAFLYQLLARCYGTNNFPDCSNMCHEATSVALAKTIGIGKGTVRIEDFEQADAIFLFGQNPGTNHPRMLETLSHATKRGARVVAFNNLKERGLERFANPQHPVELLTYSSTPTTSDYFTPKLGGDMAAVRGMVKLFNERHKKAVAQGSSLFDLEFIAQQTQGMDAYLALVEQTSWEQITEQSGLSYEQIVRAANIYQNAERVIVTWAMGVTQHKHSVATIHELVNLQLLFGQIGKPGAGLCPVRGHSNVQGDRTVGINESPAESFLARFDEVFDISAPREHGHNVVQAMQALCNAQSKVFIGLGGNIVAAVPDTQRVADAMRGAELTVNIATKLNRSHVNPGKESIILPCLGRTDIDMQVAGPQKVTVEDSFSMVHASSGRVDVSGEQMRSEPAIIAGIAKALLGATHPVDWQALVDNYDRIRDLIEAVIPGFENFNGRLDQPGGFYLGNSASDLNWKTASGKALMCADPLPEAITPVTAIERSKAPVFIMQTLRSHDQYNTTVYGYDDRYRGIFGERKIVFMNPQDMDKLNLTEGDLIDVQTLWTDNQKRQITGFKVIPYQIPQGNLAAYFPEANALIPLSSYGDESFTPTSKSIAVLVRLHQQDTQELLVKS